MPSTPPQKEHLTARDAIALEMKDSWSPGDDRRDRGRVDRGVIERRSRRSRSPTSRRPDTDRTPNIRDRSTDRSRPSQEVERRERSPDRRRQLSPRPGKDLQEEVLKRNQGRELLLETRGADTVRGNTVHSPQPIKRRKSRSPSPGRNQQKKARRNSRSPVRHNGANKGSSRRDRKRRNRSASQHRNRQSEQNRNNQRDEGNPRNRRDFGKNDKRGRSPGHNRDKYEKTRPSSSLDYDDPPTNRNQSPQRSTEKEHKDGGRPASDSIESKEKKRDLSPYLNRRSPEVDRYEHPNRGRRQSPRAPKGPKGNRRRSPKRDKGRPPRDEYRPNNKTRGRPTSAASGANSIEVKSDKMANRGFYGNQQGFNPNQQMQAAFPLKPQFNQVPQGSQADPRQFSQSPQHQMTPNSYHGSPQAQSPYSSGRGNWNGSQQQQFSPTS